MFLDELEAILMATAILLSAMCANNDGRMAGANLLEATPIVWSVGAVALFR